VQGLLLVFENIARRTPDSEPNKRLMNDALTVAVQVVEEGRDKVQVLRHVAAVGADLEQAFHDQARRLAAVHPAEFTLRRAGRPRELRPAVHEEILEVGREAIRNAFVHAKATRIDVELTYRDKALELIVRDNGRGIDPSYRAGRSRHWGIAGIRERVAEVGATCDLSSEEGEGTVWRFQITAAIAYLPDSRNTSAAQTQNDIGSEKV
jgi:signal transduction histidine kinase